MIRVFLFGRHAHCSPLSHPGFAPHLAGRVERVADPDAADLIVVAHRGDLEQETPRAAIRAWRRRRMPVVLLSEEPFWDTIWTRRPLDRDLVIDTPWGAVPVTQLNHVTSDIFVPGRLPYFLLTHDRYAGRYAPMFARNAALGADEWRAALARREMRVSFMFERRPEPHHDVAWPEAGLQGLCAWRTRLAEATRGDRVERLGRSWQVERVPSRFALDDWHADKLALLDGRAAMIGALENTHHPDYLTEKPFDAWACGALPICYAAPDHALHRMGLPAEAWINLHGQEAEAAGAGLATLDPATRAGALREAQAALADLFRAPAALLACERERVAARLAAALTEPASPD